MSAAPSDWTPPADPDPHEILREAAADTRAGRFSDALAKHVWFHEHALEHEPAMSGVRLSFALLYWKELGERHPPALAKLREFRDRAGRDVEAGEDVWRDFQEFAAINRQLEQSERTRDAFAALDARDPAAARVVFPLALPVLVATEDYRLAGKYVEPDMFDGASDAFQASLDHAADVEGEHGKLHRAFAEKSFTNEAATLIALLVVNDRKAEAEAVAAKARDAWNDPAFHEAIDSALAGAVPTPWS